MCNKRSCIYKNKRSGRVKTVTLACSSMVGPFKLRFSALLWSVLQRMGHARRRRITGPYGSSIVCSLLLYITKIMIQRGVNKLLYKSLMAFALVNPCLALTLALILTHSHSQSGSIASGIQGQINNDEEMMGI